MVTADSTGLDVRPLPVYPAGTPTALRSDRKECFPLPAAIHQGRCPSPLTKNKHDSPCPLCPFSCSPSPRTWTCGEASSHPWSRRWRPTCCPRRRRRRYQCMFCPFHRLLPLCLMALDTFARMQNHLPRVTPPPPPVGIGIM